MIEYSYPECTTSALLGLAAFQKRYPEYRRAEITAVMQKAIGYIKRSQNADGSWFGSWGICFTYAAFFALNSLAACGETYKSRQNCFD